MIRTEQNKEVFERMASTYIRDDSHWGCDLDLIKNTLDQTLKNNINPNWCDIGCGPAFHIANMSALYPEIEILGIDYSSLMLQQAEHRIKKYSLRTSKIQLKNINITEHVTKEKFDLITFLNNGFGNLYKKTENPENTRMKVIKNIAHMLKPGGHFILSVYNKEKIEEKYGNKLRLLKNRSNVENGDLFVEYIPNKKEKIIYYSHWFSESELKKIFEKTRLNMDFLERRMSRFLIRYTNS